MYSDRQLRTEFVRALDEVLPPAPWLETAVIEELHRVHKLGARDRGLGGVPHRLWSPRRQGMRLAAGLVLVAMVIAAAGVFAINRSSWLTRPSPEPAGPVSVEQYQSVTRADLQRFIASNSFACSGFDDTTCLPRVTIGDAAAKRWLDDLSRSQPPSRFAAVDYLIRRHLTLALASDVDFVAAFHARDAKAERAASDAFVAQMNALRTLGQDVTLSHQGAPSAYTTVVQSDQQTLLVDASSAACQAGPTAECSRAVASIRVDVETFQGDLVKFVAPPSFATEDARLQADLLKSDAALEVVESAVAASNLQRLQTALLTLHQSLAAVDTDAAAIART